MQDLRKREVAKWLSQLRKGTLELAVLLLLRRERSYGLDLVEQLNKANLGVSEGSIYPLLSRLKADKKVRSKWVEEGAGHAHKYYELTDYGSEVCAAMAKAWREFSGAFESLQKRSTR
jgi:PadR family transcriptional regulator PadR